MNIPPGSTTVARTAPVPRDPRLLDWLRDNAEQLDQDAHLAADVLPLLGRGGWFRIGVPAEQGGHGGSVLDAIDAIATIAEVSLSAAFVFWGQRAFVECLLQTDNAGLRDRLLRRLLDGELAGAVGLSNAMKFLAKMDDLLVHATVERPGAPAVVNGHVPFATNLRREGYVTAVAAGLREPGRTSIYVVPHDAPGVVRGDDLDLVALRSSNTASLALHDVSVEPGWLLAHDGGGFLARARPHFLGLQCGLSIGLIRGCLRALDHAGRAAQLLAEERAVLDAELREIVVDLFDGIDSGEFVAKPAQLFSIRLYLAELVEEASTLDMLAAGARGFVRSSGGVARRRREAAVIPVVTPSVLQIRAMLALQK